MGKTTRLLALILAFTFLFSGVISFAESFQDVNESTQYQDAIINLTTIGLIKGYEDGTFKPQNTITRAEFTTIVVRALAMEDIQMSGNEYGFSDVSTHYAKQSIKTAYDLGIINGFEDFTFRPDETVTYEQAVKMVVCMLGYGTNGETNGGYPTGYIAVASQLGLTKDIFTSSSAEATRGVIAKLINNSLDVKLQNTILSGDGSYRYVVTDETIFKTKLNMEKGKVLVTGVEESVIYGGESELKKGEMRVSRVSDDTEIILDYTPIYKTSSEAKAYLGHSIQIYYRHDNEMNINVLVAVDSQSQKNTEYSITSDDIEEYSNQTLTYINQSAKLQSKFQTLKLKNEDMSIVYNGKVVPKSSTISIDGNNVSVSKALELWLSPDSESFMTGELKVVDSKSDGIVDVIFINNYSVMVAASSPTLADPRVTNKLVTGQWLVLNPDDDSYTCNITRNGASASVTDIRANDIVMYAKSLDESIINVVVTSKSVQGTITELNQNEAKINDMIYVITDTFRKHIEGKQEISVGVNGTFYVNQYNHIIFGTITTTSTSTSYAYILNMSENYATEEMVANVFIPSSSSTKRLTLKDRLTFNKSTMSSENVKDRLEQTSSQSRADFENSDRVYGSLAGNIEANNIAQLVKIGTSKEEINEIITLSNEEGEYNQDKDKMVRYKPLDKYTYTATNNFNNEFYINANTTIMYVPGARASKSDYQKYTASSVFKTNQSYWIEAYDVNESKVASLVIVYGNSSLADITRDTAMSVVAKEPVGATVSDDVVTKMLFYTSSTSLTTKYTDDKEFDTSDVGDVIQFGYDNKSRLINRKNIILAKDVKSVLESKEYDWTDDLFDVSYINTENNEIEMDTTTNTPYSRAFVANVLEVQDDETESYIRVSQQGFNEDGTIKTGNEERYEITKTIPIVVYNTSKNTMSATLIDGTTTKINISDLKDVKYHGADCSKVFIHTVKGTIKFIMIYQ